MPKMKTHRGAAKRFKVTGTGKLMRRQAFRSHILEKKSSHAEAPPRPDEVEMSPGDAGRSPAGCWAADRGGRPTRTRDERSKPMARVKRAVHGKKHRRATLERAKGYYGNKSRSYRAANEQVMHSLQYAVPRPPGPQGRVPQAVDPAHQRRLPRATASATAGSSTG